MVNNITNLLPRLYIRLRIYIYILARLNIIILFKDFGKALRLAIFLPVAQFLILKLFSN